MREPDLAVALVAYRSRPYLPACLAALPAAIGGAACEIAVVDNASEDGTCEWLAEVLPDVRLLRNDANRGFAAAANQAARLTTAPFVLFLNPDAAPRPGSVALLLDAIRRDSRVALVAPQLVGLDGALQQTVWPDLGVLAVARDLVCFGRPSRAQVRDAPVDVACVSAACLLVRRSAFEALGGFDEGFFLYHEDFDLCARVRAAGFRVRFVPDARVVHHVGGSAFLDPRAFWRHYHRSRMRLIGKLHPGWRGRALTALYRGSVRLRAAAGAAAALASGSAPRAERARCHRAALAAHGREG